MSSAAISLTAFLARPLVLAQSPPPIFDRRRRLAADVLGHLVELVGRHEQAVARLAPLGARVLDDEVLAVVAVGPEPMVRCTISTNRPTPCCSCTTWSPGRSCSGSTTLRRRLGIRRMSRVLVPARPVRSDSENTRQAQRLGHEPLADGRGHDEDDTARRAPPRSSRRAARAPRRRAAARPCAARDRAPRWPARAASPPAAGRGRRRPPGRPRRGTLDVARLQDDRPRGRARSSAMPARSAGARLRAAVRPVPRRAVVRPRRPRAASTSSVNGLSVHQPSSRTAESRAPRRTTRSSPRTGRAGVAAPAAADVHAGLEELVRRRDEVVRPPADPLGVDQRRAGCRRARGRAPGTMRSTRTGASDSMPSTAMPWPSRSSMSVAPGSCGISSSARARTASVSRISRHGGAHTPCSATSRLRWSATENQRISSTSSPQSSTRSGWSSVGGKTSRMPPRTANSPRRSTMSMRVYAAPASCSTSVLEVDLVARAGSTPAPGRPARRPPAAAARGPGRPARGSGPRSPAPSGCARRRKTASRRATVSLRGERRSCGSVSHAGRTATSSRGHVAADRGRQLVGVPAGRGDDDQRTLLRERGQQRRADAGGADDVELAAGAHRVDRLGGGGIGKEGRQQAGQVHEVLRRSADAGSTIAPDPWGPGCSNSLRPPTRNG